MPNEAKSFLQAFSKDGKFFLPQPFLWKVTIDGGVTGAINSTLGKAGEKWKATTTPDEFTKDSSILVAQEVTLPNERSEYNEFGQTNRGGFLPGFGLTQRDSFLARGITINFIETDVDIEHNFFRPWAIAVGIDGLVNMGLKTTITVKQFGNDGSMRKGFKFLDAFPTACEGYTLNYGGDQSFTVKTVTFACRNYEQL
tara:strand:+ start:3431 stop:4024 length:594 start_codon:yes stop_codon:yes gene_type:complete